MICIMFSLFFYDTRAKYEISSLLLRSVSGSFQKFKFSVTTIKPSWGSFTTTNTKIDILDNLDLDWLTVSTGIIYVPTHQWFLVIFDSGPPPAFPVTLTCFCYFVSGRTFYSLNSLNSVKYSWIVLLKWFSQYYSMIIFSACIFSGPCFSPKCDSGSLGWKINTDSIYYWSERKNLNYQNLDNYLI